MRLLIIYFVLGLSLYSCTKYKIQIPEVADITVPSDVSVENSSGKSTISYTVTDTRAAYVLVEYMPVEDGPTRSITVPRSENSVTIEGFPVAGEYEVKLYAVAESGTRSAPLKVGVNPTTPHHILVLQTVETEDIFGGIIVRATNELSEPLVFDFFFKSSSEEWIKVDSYTVNTEEIEYTLSGLGAGVQELGISIRDRWQNASDTVSMAIQPLIEAKINVSQGGYVHYSLPTDLATDNLLAGWGFDRLFDGYIVGTGITVFSKTNTAPAFPVHFSVDLKDTYALTKVKVFQRTAANGNGEAYRWSNPKKFRVWGSNDPNTNGSFDESWTMLGDFEFIRPSGLPHTTVPNALDNEKANAGEDFQLVSGGTAPSFRYLRFQFLENWGGTNGLHMAEIEIYGTKK